MEVAMGFLSKLFGPREPKLMPVSIDDDNFEREVMKSELPVMLDIWGPGCAPCKQLEPIVIRFANEYRGRVKVAELNAENAPRTMRRLRVRGTPTVLYYRGRREVERVVGFRGEPYHREIIETELLDSEAQAATG
jgi:thioredoxin 1